MEHFLRTHLYEISLVFALTVFSENLKNARGSLINNILKQKNYSKCAKEKLIK